jgi:hypothetical protein
LESSANWEHRVKCCQNSVVFVSSFSLICKINLGRVHRLFSLGGMIHNHGIVIQGRVLFYVYILQEALWINVATTGAKVLGDYLR